VVAVEVEVNLGGEGKNHPNGLGEPALQVVCKDEVILVDVAATPIVEVKQVEVPMVVEGEQEGVPVVVGEEIEMMQFMAAPVVAEESAATQLGLLQALMHEQTLQREAVQIIYKEVLPVPTELLFTEHISQLLFSCFDVARFGFFLLAARRITSFAFLPPNVLLCFLSDQGGSVTIGGRAGCVGCGCSTNIQTHTHIHTHAITDRQPHRHAQTHAHTHAHTHTHTHTHTYTHAHTHTHTHTHTGVWDRTRWREKFEAENAVVHTLARTYSYWHIST
jgi:hypothetical protein